MNDRRPAYMSCWRCKFDAFDQHSTVAQIHNVIPKICIIKSQLNLLVFVWESATAIAINAENCPPLNDEKGNF